MARRLRIRALLGTPVVLAALALTSCGSSQTTASSRAGSRASASTPTSPATPASSASSTSTGAAATAPECSSSQLRLAYAGTQGATGHLEVTFRFDNVSTRRCALRGHPNARLLGPTGKPLPMRVQWGDGFFPDIARTAGTVLVAPGGAARFGMSFAVNNEFAHAHVCRTAAAAMSTAPGDPRWLRVDLPAAPVVRPCGDQLVVSPVR